MNYTLLSIPRQQKNVPAPKTGKDNIPRACVKSERNPIYHKKKVLLIDLEFLDEEKERIFNGGLSRGWSLP
jgi:hypothetical protein